MSKQEIVFAVVVGFISAVGVIAGAYLTMYATKKAALIAAQGVDNQIKLNSAVKIAEFRQAWIDDLREAMAEFVALALTLERHDLRHIYQVQAKITLLMNRKDARYETLNDRMNAVITETDLIKSSVNESNFLIVCQDILKQEWETLKKEIGHLPGNGIKQHHLEIFS